MELSAVLILYGIEAFALLLLWKEGLLNKTRTLLIVFVVLSAAFIVRQIGFPRATGDYNSFLSIWVDHFRNNGGFAGLSEGLGNYNIPYYYFLALFSYSSIYDLYLIKLLSVFFDVILAWSAMKLVGVYTKSVTRRLVAFLGVMLLPTVILNGAHWGQCDSIYVAFAVMSIYLVLSDRPVLSLVTMALSLAFKLQAVFFMPIFLPLLIAKRVKLWHYLVFPVTYILTLMPAVLLGRPFLEALTIYFTEADTVGSGLNYNSPSIFALLRGITNTALASNIAIIAAFIFTGIVLVQLIRSGKRLTNGEILVGTVLLSLAIPYLLPHMHDRYFFGADVLTFALAVVWVRAAPVAVLTSFASLICYYSYLNSYSYILPLSTGALAIGIAIILLTVALFQRTKVRNL